VTFELATAAKVVFGDGVVSRLADLSSAIAGPRARVLFVTGGSAERTAAIARSLEAGGLALTPLSVRGEPTTDVARSGVALARAEACTVVVAIGGGSVIDLGKAIAALVTNAGDPLDYLEVVGRGQPLLAAPLPFLAVPTTAGTGAEVTKNAVLADPGSRVKVSLRSDAMLPRVALVDPELTWSMPRAVTASTGMDAITQVIEPFVSNAASPVTDALCRDAIARGAGAIRRAFARGDDREARRDMALTSLFGGIALANAKLGAVHGFAGPIGGAFESPHGAVCACLLPLVMEVNVRALRARADGSSVLARYEEVARLVTGSASAKAEDGVDWARALAADLGIPPLSTYGMTPEHVTDVAAKSARASSMKGNPIVLTSGELEEILARAL
jgi:alcohol dehydrogenase class IV